jgi:DNA-directed RNA polymerase
MDTLSGCIRHSFVQMYEDHDVLTELRERVSEIVGPRIAKNLEPVPEKGKLDITAVLESPFFFA